MATKDMPMDVEVLAKAISAGITEAAEQTGPIRQIPITKYRPKTPWNPAGTPEHLRPQMTREYYQNGALVDLWHITDADIKLLNELRPGIYIDRRVEVVERRSESGQKHSLEIRYNNATPDQRFELKNLFRSFSELLQLIVAEQQTGSAA